MDDHIETGIKLLPNRDDHQCFGCGPANPSGLRMKFFTDDTSVFSWLKVPDHLIGWDNLVHGGVLSTILDEIMSWSAIYLLKKLILTKSMTVDFIKPVYVGAELKVEGTVFEKQSDKEAVMQGRIYNKEGVLCAKSKGIYVLLKPKVAKKLNMMSAEAIKDFEPILKA
ncbi:MAG: PaaI family thioesterase [Deltaproteobacteria bacterium]|nr:PaaI family thioesterase [Deltaproteobacteria bacterium]